MGLNGTKLVLWVSDKARIKPVSQDTQSSKKIEISLVASLDIKLSEKRITKVLISLRGCADWSVPLLFLNLRRQVFLRRGPYDVGAYLKHFNETSILRTDFPIHL